jgi:ribosomal protein S18 acetylase RimI-like enzyme
MKQREKLVGGMKYIKTSKTPKLFYDGWGEIIKKGYHPKMLEYSEEYLSHIVAKKGRKNVGVISYYLDSAIEGQEAVIQMIYVLPNYRKGYIAQHLYEELELLCEKQEIRFLSATANIDNEKSLRFFKSMGSNSKFTTFQKKIGG